MKKSNKVIVFFSGNGTNLQSLIDHQLQYDYNIIAALCNNPRASGIQKALNSQVETLIIDHQKYGSRLLFDNAVAEAIENYNPDLIVLAGFMRILGKEFIDKYSNKIINLHPSLLPSYKGLNTYERVLADKQQKHGCTVHFVVPELDSGNHILQAQLNIKANDTIAILKQRVQNMEHVIYPWVVCQFIKQRIVIRNNQVLLDGKVLPQFGYVVDESNLDQLNRI